MGLGEDIYGMNWFLLGLTIAVIYELYVIVWKGRNNRKLVNFLKEEAIKSGQDPDVVLNNLIMDYVNKQRKIMVEEIQHKYTELQERPD